MLHKAGVVARVGILLGVILFGFGRFAEGQDDSEFFESRIRPVLVESCYECHNSHDRAEGGLALDWRDGIRAKSSNGTVVVPEAPDKSLLLKVIRHEIEGLEMPEGRERLPDKVIQDFETWIRRGAQDPRADPPSEEELEEQLSWDAKFAKRKQRWCFQPIGKPEPPPSTSWSQHPIDRFVVEKMRRHGLSPAPRAGRRDLVRRLSYALTGLPPDQETVDHFLNDSDTSAFEKLVDQYLASPQFGERWARHWMDWIRYADSHGSEGDPAIPFAYRYRDYLIRAINQDVPYDQLLREHLAGDLLDPPRRNSELGLNESAIGTAHLRFVFHGFAPTDALDEKVRFTDDQINVFGKAFLGMTISCARCHDHKFDAISQRDYYALFGVFGSCRPAMQDVNTRQTQGLNRAELSQLKRNIRDRLAESWLGEIRDWNPQKLESKQLESNSNVSRIWMNLVERLRGGSDFENAWQEIEKEWQRELSSPSKPPLVNASRSWDLGKPRDFAKWLPQGNGIGDSPSPPGDFVVALEEGKAVDAILPSGVYTHSLSTIHRGVLDSPRFVAEPGEKVFVQLMGGGQSSIRYVVQNYPRDGTVFPIHRINRPNWYWHTLDLDYWAGDQVHLELATANDTPLKIAARDRSWFGVRRVIVQDKRQPPPETDRYEDIRFLWEQLRTARPKSLDDVADCYRNAIALALQAWQSGKCSDAQALFLNACLNSGWLSNDDAIDSKLQVGLATYRELESKTPAPTRVPGVAEGHASDQPLFHRGDHRQPQESVPRGFLSVLGSKPFKTQESGRRELAEAMVAPGNPLTSRVMVNRIWLHLFGTGIVDTPDNFGELGAMPTHPELLDYLASRFRDEGWSIKNTIRMMVLSQTWQQDSSPSADALRTDPGNRWLSHANVRRLDAESIRDTLLAVSGELDPRLYGPTVNANSNTLRRSIYVRSNRNSLDHFLTTFDAPVPFSTVGKRHVTNVPAQALALMNGDFVMQRAVRIGALVSQETQITEKERIGKLIRTVLGRPAEDPEIEQLRTYLEGVRRRAATREATLKSLVQQRAQTNRRLQEIWEPAKRALLKSKEQDVRQSGSDLAPVARWEFNRGGKDLVGALDVALVGTAKITEDGLRLDGNGFARTPPLKMEVTEKTLEVLLRLNSLEQRAGGAMGIQDLAGNRFDSIVFAEQAPRRWMAGSEFFKRTKPISEALDETSDAVVHLAIAYEKDGTIRAYRNGRPYGKPYNSGNVLTLEKGQSQIVFGIRHGTKVTPGRMLGGWLIAARFYNRALSSAEIEASYAGHPYVSRKEVLASLSPGERQEIKSLESQLANLSEQEAALAIERPSMDAYALAAHMLLNLKELIYVR